jgi:3-deoxy-manno-octulosonate cytidylyltransferase (CMP-KDO synthetase)
MVVRVWKQTTRSRLMEKVVVATDDERIAAVVRAAGGEAMMTSAEHSSGTDRVAEVARHLPADIYVNVQGDLPFLDPADLDTLVAPMKADEGIAMATLATPIIDEHEWRNPNVVKVVVAANGDALYFSRSAIPFQRVGGRQGCALRHIGVYAYRRDFLFTFSALPQGKLEQVEKLEQLRALESGYRIRVVTSVAPSLEVDTAEDLARARQAAKPS